MLPQEIIRKKRDGHSLSGEEIQYYIEGIAEGLVNESHIAAFSMAVIFNGMTVDETFYLTDQMMKSGDTLNWDNLDGPVIDKHSTGGVGDKISLLLAPIVAACGIYNPMISGRGLGHTGGTLDKLESIPGYNTTPDNDHFRQVVKKVGCAIIGQTDNLAPADKIIYGVRDVTATVESIPLITASILSKKIAAGLDGLVMDIKMGNGAFADQKDFALELGKNIIHVGKEFGMKTTALITDMNQPLGTNVGNSLEVQEVIDYLTGSERDKRLHEVVLSLSAEMVIIAGLSGSKKEAINEITRVLDSGKAAEKFEEMVMTLGGSGNILEGKFKQSDIIKPIPATQTGFISNIQTRDVGLAVVSLGGGRKKASDTIDHSVGLTEISGLGNYIEVGQPLAMVHAKNETQANHAIELIQQAYSINDSKVDPLPIVIQQLI
ncbi:MAG: thymidine phosphorylase [Candidatus Marinimicrobia bacterium]|nr:thymidine phosphorylase [Candidatus Neomarinimicrobiota bacterium]